MIIRSSAASTLLFVWRESAHRFHTAERALQFLADFKADPLAMAGFRRLLGERSLRHDPAHMTDDEVLQAVAALLANGELLAGTEWKPRVEAPPAEEAAAAPAAKPSSEPAAEEPEPSTFGSSSDAAAQAGALIAAAQSGVPFCEECERARAQGGAQ